jgi:hypothetical protein
MRRLSIPSGGCGSRRMAASRSVRTRHPKGLYPGRDADPVEVFRLPPQVLRHVGHPVPQPQARDRDYLAVLALFCNGLKGVAALHMARDMNINPKSAFVLLHKLRQAMGAEVHGGDELGGADRQAEVDGAYFGKGPRQANRKADRVDRRTLDTERQASLSRANVTATPGRGLSGAKAMPFR